MEKQLASYARGKIKEGLPKLSEGQRNKCKHIYSENYKMLSANEIVDNMPDDKLDHALWLVNKTLNTGGKI
ncbi:MAG: hypothetical protein HQ538_01330 [Parcubacteria group bacterium]|nr:hypothetical protein [Parcubacteria group bacterium]